MKLSPAQRRVLEALSKGHLIRFHSASIIDVHPRDSFWWAEPGRNPSVATMSTLASKGLVRYWRDSEGGAVEITPAGRAALKETTDG